jgi:hypothetical protein
VRKLIMIHGRSQQMKDPSALKQTWVTAMHQGMSNAGLTLSIDDADIRFPYYGDALVGLLGSNPQNAPGIQIKGLSDGSEGERQFVESMVQEAADSFGVNESDIRKHYEPAIIERGFLNWPWVLATLRAIDAVGGGSLAVELFTHDVYAYLTNPVVRDAIDEGVRAAFDTTEAVVLAHSLGTIVGFELLRREGSVNSWNVSTFITVGCPLSVGPVAHALAPIKFPHCVGKWNTARDPKDTVALRPLVPPWFPAFPITAKDTVHNNSPNHHGIESYLADPTVAHWLYEALTTP